MQQGNRNRLELRIVTSIHPRNALDDQQRQILQDVKLDGHWLVTAICHHLSQLDIDLSVGRQPFQYAVLSDADAIRESLFNDIVGEFEAVGMCDDDLIRLEAFLEEYLPALTPAIEKIVFEICDLLSRFDPPEFCLKKDLLKYLSGYSIQDDYTGLLHFDFRDR